MRTRGLFVIALLAAVLAGCSSDDEPLAVELTHPQGHGVLSFTASGAGVTGEAICPNGTMEMVRLEAMDGTSITDDDWAAMFDSALAEGSTAEMMVFEEWSCADDSGTFTVAFHNRFDFATFEFEGQQDVGTWEIRDGTGSYTDLTGSGSATLDWDQEAAVYRGEIEG